MTPERLRNADDGPNGSAHLYSRADQRARRLPRPQRLGGSRVQNRHRLSVSDFILQERPTREEADSQGREELVIHGPQIPRQALRPPEDAGIRLPLKRVDFRGGHGLDARHAPDDLDDRSSPRFATLMGTVHSVGPAVTDVDDIEVLGLKAGGLNEELAKSRYHERGRDGQKNTQSRFPSQEQPRDIPTSNPRPEAGSIKKGQEIDSDGGASRTKPRPQQRQTTSLGRSRQSAVDPSLQHQTLAGQVARFSATRRQRSSTTAKPVPRRLRKSATTGPG